MAVVHGENPAILEILIQNKMGLWDSTWKARPTDGSLKWDQ